MVLRPIKKYPEKVLRKKAKEVTRFGILLDQLVEDMAKTMYAAPGVGLAAPQIGISRRVIVIDVGKGLISMINPKIVERQGSEVGVEGCLSFPNFYGDVERPAIITVKYQNLQEQWEKLQADELLARAIQHEIDHLDGIVFIDKAVNLRYIVPEEFKNISGCRQEVGSVDSDRRSMLSTDRQEVGSAECDRMSWQSAAASIA